MQTYHTQMEAARKHIITPQMKTVAEKERVDVEWLLQLERFVFRRTFTTLPFLRRESAQDCGQKLT